jgi:hypothetical protein
MVRSAGPRRIALLAAHNVAEADGIRDYDAARNWDQRPAARVGQRDRPAEDGSRRPSVPAAELEDADPVILQHCPFSSGGWSFVPTFPLLVGRLRRKRPRPLIAVMFHDV